MLRSVVFVGISLVCIFILSPSANAQVEYPEGSAPPPVKLDPSSDEASRITGQDSPKEQAKAAIEILTARLKLAEDKAQAGDNDGVYTELGDFAGVMNLSLKLLLKYDERGDLPLDALKRFELGLRVIMPRLEVLRRNVPIEYEPFIKSVVISVDAAREKALDPMYGTTVIQSPNTPK